MGITVSEFSDFLYLTGKDIYRFDDVINDYIFALVWSLILGISILIWPIPYQHRRILVLLWILRCLVTLGIMIFMEYFYKGVIDGITYALTGKTKITSLRTIFQGGTSTINALCWIHQQILPGTYHIAKISFSLIGLIAIYIFYRAVSHFLQYEDNRILYIIGLFPSILFWSSLLGKEPIILFGISLYTYGIIHQYQKPKFRFILLTILGIAIAMLIRPWMGIILCLPLVTFVFTQKRKLGTHILLAGLFITITYFSFNIFLNRFNLNSPEILFEKTSELQKNFAIGGSVSNSGFDLSNSSGVLLYLPIGIITALFRPFPGEVLNIFGILAGLENTILILLFWNAIKQWNPEKLRNPIIIWSIVLVMVWATFYAIGASYNLGTIFRYRLQILPIWLCLLLYLGQKKLSTDKTHYAQNNPHHHWTQYRRG